MFDAKSFSKLKFGMIFFPTVVRKKKKRSKIRRRRQKVAFVAKRTFNLSTLTEVVENLL